MATPGDDDLLHITTPDGWAAAQRAGAVTATMNSEGFVHCSTRAQLPGTLGRHFAGAGPLLGLVLDPARVGDLRWEESFGGRRFPHVYNPLPLDAVMAVEPLDAPPPAGTQVMEGVDGLVDETGDGDAVLAVHVQPGARRTEVVGRHGDALKVRVQAPADKGKANAAVVTLLASTFEVPDSAVVLVRGASSRAKRFRLVDLPAAAARARLAAVIGGRGATR